MYEDRFPIFRANGSNHEAELMKDAVKTCDAVHTALDPLARVLRATCWAWCLSYKPLSVLVPVPLMTTP